MHHFNAPTPGLANQRESGYRIVLAQRIQDFRNRRESVLGKMARTRAAESSPLSTLSNVQLTAFATNLRSRLLDRSTSFPKHYLQTLVSEITFDGQKVRMQGRKAAALEAAAGKKMGTYNKVPTFSHGWLPDLGSNQGPTD